MRDFLSALVRAASRNVGVPFVAGFNTGIGPADGPLNNYGDVDRFMALQETGFPDALGAHQRDLTEDTCTQPGPGGRIGSTALASREAATHSRLPLFSSGTRQPASDHSVLLVEIED
jgi:hypothetical protein